MTAGTIVAIGLLVICCAAISLIAALAIEQAQLALQGRFTLDRFFVALGLQICAASAIAVCGSGAFLILLF